MCSFSSRLVTGKAVQKHELRIIVRAHNFIWYSCGWDASRVCNRYRGIGLSRLAGQDLAIAGETVQRLFDGFLLLAVPLFIVSANIMNAGSISDRLLKFCVAIVGRFRGGLGHVNVVASLIFS